MREDLLLLGFGPDGWGRALLTAAETTLAVSVCAFAIGNLLGLVLAWAKLGGGKGLQRLADIYSVVLRGVPELLVIYLFYFGGRQVLGLVTHLFGYAGHPDINGFAAGALAIGLISAAGQAEVLRGAYGAIPRGTLEAGLVGGMGPWTLLRRVILPQGAVTALPGLGNQWQSVVKESALVSVTGLVETMRAVTIAAGSTDLPFLFYAAGAVLFLAITTLSGAVFRALEWRVRRWAPADGPNLMAFLQEVLAELLAGLPLTIELTALSLGGGAVLALALSGLRASSWAGAWLANTYVFLFRGSPLLIQIFLIYYGLPQFGFIRHGALWPLFRDPFFCAALAFMLNEAAYTSEILRGGLRAVPRGAVDAAIVGNMGRWTMLRRVVLPLAVRQALPAYGIEITSMLKATSLASVVSLMDVTGIARAIVSETYRAIEVFGVAAVIYLVLVTLTTTGVRALERRLAIA